MISPITFLAQVRDELKLVTWPTQTEVIRLTIVVIAISLIIGGFIGGLDLGLTKLQETLFIK